MTSQRLLLALLTALLLSSLAAAAPPADLTPADTQDVILLTGPRPLRLRLHLLVGDRPFSARWTDFLCKLFALLDRNEDGVLDTTEMARAPLPAQLKACFSGYPFFVRGPGAKNESMDGNRDGFVSLNEFVAYYRPQAGPLQIAPFYGYGPNPDVFSERLFVLLDTDQNRHLSRQELEAAPTVLAQLDTDDDEMISNQELLVGAAPGTRSVGVRFRRAVPLPPSLLLLGSKPAGRRIDAPLGIVQEMLKHYDRDHNKKLSRDEVALPGATFDKLDQNRDGQLEVSELIHFSALPPEAEVVLRLSLQPNGSSTVEVVTKGGSKGLRAPAGNPDGNPTLVLEGLKLKLVGAPAMPGSMASYRTFLHQQLKLLDKENKGFVTRKQLQDPRGQLLRGVLELVDHEGSDRLTLQKIDAWIELMSSGATCSMSLMLATSGNGLFQVLDANRDGRLSVRELRNAWARVAEHVAPGSRGLGRDDLPQQYRLVANAGGPNYAYSQVYNRGLRGPANPGTAAGQRGPLWFRKMDRNHDGDVSLREFLGTVEQFRRLDRDGDGLISLHEAEQAGGRLPAKKTGR